MPVDVAQGAKGLHEDAATDVDTHDVGDDFLAQVARETDDATRPGMDVGHDAHPAARKRRDGHQSAQLVEGSGLDAVGENLDVVCVQRDHIAKFLCDTGQNYAPLLPTCGTGRAFFAPLCQKWRTGQQNFPSPRPKRRET